MEKHIENKMIEETQKLVDSIDWNKIVQEALEELKG